MAIAFRQRSYVAIAAATSLLAACSGGSASRPSPPGSDGTSTSARFAIVIPPAVRPATAGRRRAYVSPSTMSLSIAGHAAGATAGPALVVDVSAGSNACAADATGARTCDVAVGAAAGVTSFDIRSFDAPAGAGSQLAHALVALPATTAPVVAITVVLDGDAATVALALAGAPFVQGVAGSQTLAVTAADADGNVITGPGLYDVPVLLAPSDGAIALTPTTVTGPGQTVTVAYDGAPGSTSFVTAAVVGSASGGTVLRVVGPQAPASTPSPFPTGVPVAPTPTPGVSAIIVVH